MQKLRDAAEQVKYRLDNLDQRQKKILCSLFIDRVEMRRAKVGGRWKIAGQVIFRFNPSKFEENGEEGRTMKTQQKANASASEDKNAVDGGR